MGILEWIFFVSLFIVFYAYLGYGILLGILVKLKGRSDTQSIPSNDQLPEVAMVVAAYNEADIIEQKINNCLAIDYPDDKLHFYFVTDGSTDPTPELIRRYPRIQLFHKPARAGKMAAVDRVMDRVNEPITIYSDANAMVNPEAVKLMVRHFQNDRIGAVAGEKSIRQSETADASSSGEGIYWRYESLLKKWDYQLYSVVGAAGELFGIRSSLYEKPEIDTLIEDFVMTLRIAQKGFRVAYEPEARAYETSSDGLNEELKRKVRICAGGLQAVWRLAPLLNPFKHGVLSFQYISHRVLRWTLAPLALLVILVTNVLLVKSGDPIFLALMIGQVLFYGSALLGYYLEDFQIRIKALFIPLYFTFMNLSVYLGLFKLLTGDFSVTWEKAKRKLA